MKKNIVTLLAVLIIAVWIIGYIQYTDKLQPSENNQKIDGYKDIKRHVPINLSKSDILISFRIDDITFSKYQKQVLENALILARKYNVTFDLAVIAKPFDEKVDQDTYQIYLDNQDIFEVVAHGLTHAPIYNKSSGEFYDYVNKKPIPSKIQEEHIKEMMDIFIKYKLTNFGTKIFALPWSYGDQTTIELAKKYGYRLMTQKYIPGTGTEYNDGYIIVSRNWISVDANQTIKPNDIQKYKNGIYKIIKNNQTRIQIISHPINFYKIENSENLIDQIVNEYVNNSKIRFGMISDRLSDK